MDTLTHAWQWLSSPISGNNQHLIAPAVYWHARVMVLAWGVCLPVGALMARYFKVTPKQDWPRVLDNQMWWHGHRGLQYTGVLLMSLGLFLVWSSSDAGASPMSNVSNVSNVARLHHVLGWCVLILGWAQMLGGILRGSKGGPTDPHMAGDHYDMTRWRVVFERLHKSLGWLAIVLAVPVILLGLLNADAPRWMLGLLMVWWSVLLAVAAHWQRRGYCMDTYQAIWGTDPHMPGMQGAPIGWGVRRTQQHPWRSVAPPTPPTSSRF
ncbi:cytochrome b561 domain-containing protein [Limnohabitans sp.]|uniref:cytochrome b561 domain-containing protein n=1 Tax=Limnohabitans sp. TaxID=1907725 RepID=UPI00286EFE27|nr:cytochrome b561 domain-containing protein [Limnohabitans sp.]